MRHLVTVLALLLFTAGAANGREVAGVKLPDSIRLADTTLQLNGAGVRTKFFMKIYVGSLYLPARTTDAAKAIGMAGPKRIGMHFLFKEVPKDKLVEGWIEGFEKNHAQQQMQVLRERLQRFNRLFPDLHAGDVVHFDYIPGRGTEVHINNELKDTIPGADFNRALLRVWLGNKPGDRSLKKAMLGG